MQRRTLISGLMALLPAVGARRLLANEHPGGSAARSCRLITQDVAGPYHVDEYLIRSDVRDGHAGVPLMLEFQVIDALKCAPLPGALVTIWHANGEGLYSGVKNLVLNARLEPDGGMVDTRGQSFCRGIQRTDAEGRARFTTIFPGWYYPRATHLHVKVAPPDFGEEATTQLYFGNSVCDEVYATTHYAGRGPNPTRTEPGEESGLFASRADDLWLDLRKTGEGYSAVHELGVAFYGGMFGELTDHYRQS